LDKKIKVAVVGVGNCASSLVQGISYYKKHRDGGADLTGLMNWELGGYTPADIEFVAAFDIDRRKVGKPLREAIFAKPNCTVTFFDQVLDTVKVQMAPVLDGVSDHMRDYPDNRTFLLSDAAPVDVEKVLRDSGADVLLNYVPVGSEQAARFYAEACLNTGVSFINCMPVFIVSDEKWAKRFEEKGIPCVGDDIKAQLGATVLHRTLMRLFQDRGVQVDRTYQINTGGNTDFLNMLNHARLKSKKISKTEAVQSQLAVPMDEENIHIGPSDYVPWQNDNKVCFLRIEGRGFGGVPLHIEARLSVEDSPNSAGVSIDALRAVKIARDRKIGGALTSVSAYLMKHPPEQYTDTEALEMLQAFVAGRRDR
jgi:myo-inositol-1-phosphate synthase